MTKRPNILLILAEDWSWPHASIYGQKFVKTPAFDRIAKEGVLFTHAFATVSSCTPSRASILTGQIHWRLGKAISHTEDSKLHARYEVYPDIFEKMGYAVGFSPKGGWRSMWADGAGRSRNPAGEKHQSFQEFFQSLPRDQPFCFWQGSHYAHRRFKIVPKHSAVDSSLLNIPQYWPDVETVRKDFLDYLSDVEAFDQEVSRTLEILEEAGELENTLIVVTADHGMAFPRAKTNLYDMGVRVPLAIRWGNKVKGGRVVHDLVSLSDLAPTFMETLGLKPNAEMTGQSLLPILLSELEGIIEPERKQIYTAREVHGTFYPCRAIRTRDYLYIYNFRTHLMPNGEYFKGADNSPTKSFIINHQNVPAYKRYFELNFGYRPQEELYDLKKDPDQVNNVAYDPSYDTTRSELSKKLSDYMLETGDIREIQ